MTEPQDDFPPHAVINAKLAEVVKSSPSVPVWYDAWMLLGPQSSSEERLKVYQSVRDAGSLPDEAGFYLVAWQVDAITSERGETELADLEERLHQLQREEAGDDMLDEIESSSSEYESLLKEYQTAWDDLFARTLKEYGESEISNVFQNNPAKFEQIHEAGRQYFHGPDGLGWLEELVESIAECVEVFDPMGPLGYRWHEEEGEFWEIDVYPTPVELLGGAVDGAIVDPGYSLDLAALQDVFQQVEDLSWNTHGYHGRESPFVSVEGIFQERNVYVRVLAVAPEGEEPGMRFKVSR